MVHASDVRACAGLNQLAQEENRTMRRALSLLIAFSWLLNGCHSWQTQDVAPAGYIQSQHPGKIRLTLQDATQLTLKSPAVMGDSIVGAVGGDSALQAVAASDVRSLEVRRVSAGKSIALGLGIAAGVFLALLGVYEISCSVSDC
jgi:hypothetical protein